ncbi:MAG: rRNA maturation RNase YbeY [Deltaproteobacteria bacterium]|nr:rRNA maturation RNase YbeY [Deltaproteobacteria bacterium]MCL5892226.1 rRNA maturation RNase YbeY [Deltaproteobacteria bacterium]
MKKRKPKKIVNITNLQRKQGINQRLVRYIVHSAIENLFCGSYEIDIIFCSPAYIRKLNKAYLHKDAATDVLSFGINEYEGDIFHIGEIYIAPSVARKNYLKYRDFWEKEKWIKNSISSDKINGFNKELALLIIHGILHLFGYVHDEEHILDINDETYDKEMKDMQKLLFDKI